MEVQKQQGLLSENYYSVQHVNFMTKCIDANLKNFQLNTQAYENLACEKECYEAHISTHFLQSSIYGVLYDD